MKSYQNSINETLESKIENQEDEYFNVISFQMEPANDAYFKRLAIKLMLWLKKDKKANCMEQFYNLEGLNEASYYRWLEKSKELKAAHQFALRQIGINRQNIAIERNLGVSATASYVLPQYLNSWKQERDERIAANKIQDEKDRSFTILMNTAPNTNIVPNKE